MKPRHFLRWFSGKNWEKTPKKWRSPTFFGEATVGVGFEYVLLRSCSLLIFEQILQNKVGAGALKRARYGDSKFQCWKTRLRAWDSLRFTNKPSICQIRCWSETFFPQAINPVVLGFSMQPRCVRLGVCCWCSTNTWCIHHDILWFQRWSSWKMGWSRRAVSDVELVHCFDAKYDLTVEFQIHEKCLPNLKKRHCALGSTMMRMRSLILWGANHDDRVIWVISMKSLFVVSLLRACSGRWCIFFSEAWYGKVDHQEVAERFARKPDLFAQLL